MIVVLTKANTVKLTPNNQAQKSRSVGSAFLYSCRLVSAHAKLFLEVVNIHATFAEAFIP